MYFEYNCESDVKHAKLYYGPKEQPRSVELLASIVVDQFNAYGSPTYYTGAPDPVMRVSTGSEISFFSYMAHEDWEALNQYKAEHGDFHIQEIVIKPWWRPKVRFPADHMKLIESVGAQARENDSDIIYVRMVFDTLNTSRLPDVWL